MTYPISQAQADAAQVTSNSFLPAYDDVMISWVNDPRYAIRLVTYRAQLATLVDVFNVYIQKSLTSSGPSVTDVNNLIYVINTLKTTANSFTGPIVTTIASIFRYQQSQINTVIENIK